MSRMTNSPFNYVSGKQQLIGRTGKHGEVVTATLHYGDRAVVSLTADLHKVRDFDGLIIINTQGELAQFLGIYFHGDIYPYTWQKLTDDLVKFIHKAVGKGRGQRKIIKSLKYVKHENEEYFLCDNERVIFKHFYNVFLKGSFADKVYGSDDRFIRKQAVILMNVISLRKGDTNLKFVSGATTTKTKDPAAKRMISKAESHPVLEPKE